MPKKKFPGIPDPNRTVDGMFETVLTLKQLAETLSGQRRGSRGQSAVTWDDLVELGLIEELQIPTE